MSQRASGGGGTNAPHSRHHRGSWDDPYDDSDSDVGSGTAEDNINADDHNVYYAASTAAAAAADGGGGIGNTSAARRRPMGSLYAATVHQHSPPAHPLLPGAHSIRGETPPIQHSNAQEPLMYAPSVTSRRQSSRSTPAATSDNSSLHVSFARQQQPGQGQGHHQAVHPHAPTTDTTAAGMLYDTSIVGVGVGVPHEEEEVDTDYYHDDMQQQQQHSQRLGGRTTTMPTAAISPIVTPPLPTYKECKPPTFRYQPLEPSSLSSSATTGTTGGSGSGSSASFVTRRRSRRYLKSSSDRRPDIVEGQDVSTRPPAARAHVAIVACQACLSQWQVPEEAVLMQCPICQHVSPVTPVKLKHLHEHHSAHVQKR